eukprot:403351736
MFEIFNFKQKLARSLTLLSFWFLTISAFKYTFNNQTFEQYKLKTYSKGYIEEYLVGKNDEFCDSWVLFPGTTLVSSTKLSGAYFVMMLYLFLGLIVLQDKMFGAIEIILAQKAKVIRKDKNHNQIELPMELWNPSVATITVMAISANSPLLILNLIDLIQDTSGEINSNQIGIFALIGQAAFQVLFISGVTIMSVSSSQVKKVLNFDIYLILSAFSIFGLVWIYIILEVQSPHTVTFPEAFFTLSIFIALVLVLFIVDKHRETKMPQYYDRIINHQLEEKSQKNPYSIHQYLAFFELQQIIREKGETHIIDILVNDSTNIDEFEKERVKMLALNALDLDTIYELLCDPEQIEQILSNLYQQSLDQLYYRKNLLSKFTNSTNSFMKVNKFYCQKFVENEEITSQRPNPRIGFKSMQYTVIENCGTFTVTICKKTREDIMVGIRTVDGTAKQIDDYIPIYDVVKVSYIEYKLDVKIVDDEEYEPEEEFYIELFDPENNKRLIGEDTITKIIIVDEAKDPIIGFKFTSVKVHPIERNVSLKVTRIGDANHKASVYYCTEEIKDNLNAAAEAEDFEPIRKAELEFDVGELEKQIDIKLVEKDEEEIEEEGEIYLVFKVRLLDPQPENIRLSLKDTCLVEITNQQNPDFKHYKEVTNLLSNQLEEITVRTWNEQFKEACKLYPNVNQYGKVEDISLQQCLFHLLTIGWKVFFSIIPPKQYYYGFPTLICCYLMTTAIAFVLREFALLFACVNKIPDAFVGITILAVGTSIIDLLAIRKTAKKSPFIEGQCGCDQTLGYILASVNVNILIGLGLPWLVAVIHVGITEGQMYSIDRSVDISFACLILAFALVLIVSVQIVRRYKSGGEIGSKNAFEKGLVGFILITLWFVYIILCNLRFYDQL